MRTFVVELPDGTTHKRNSKTRDYHYAVAVDRSSDLHGSWRAEGWGVWGWSGDIHNAEKAAAAASRAYAKVQIIPLQD